MGELEVACVSKAVPRLVFLLFLDLGHLRRAVLVDLKTIVK